MSGVEVKEGRRVVGSDLARHDAIEKVAGRTVYAADFALPGMLHARLKRSDYAHARLTRIDTAAAEAIDGVVAVYTAADVPRNTVWVDVPGQTLEVGALKARSNVLAEDVVRYDGEPIALVAAESDDAALAALAAIEVDYEPLPVVDDPERALDDDAPQIHEGGNLLAHWELEEGDVEAGLEAAEAVVEDEYRTQFIDHAYLEPEAGVSWRDTDGVITIRAATQVVEHFRDVARILDLPDNKVRLITPYVGGGFGGKEDMTVEPYLGIVVALTGRPARMVWSRQESLQARQNRHAVRMRYRTGADADGRLVAMDVDILSDGGAYALLSALVLLYSTTCAAGPYRCPNVRIRARTVYTNHTPCSAMRGFGGMQVVLGYEGQMDRLAERLGIDPLELRRRNFVERGDTLPIGQPLETTVELPALIDALSERLGPSPSRADPARRRARLRLQPAAVRALRLAQRLVERLDRVRARRHARDPDRGPGHRRRPGLVADPDRLRGARRGARADRDPHRRLGAQPAHRHDHRDAAALHVRQRRAEGGAELREQLAGVAAELLEVEPERVEFEAEGVRERDGERAIEFRKLLAACASVDVPWHVHSTYRAPKGVPWQADESWRGRVFPDFTYGCHAADVEVDLDSGRTRSCATWRPTTWARRSTRSRSRARSRARWRWGSATRSPRRSSSGRART